MSRKSEIIKGVLDRLILEAPVDYGDRPERMDPSHETNLANKTTTFSQHPSMPEVDPAGIPSDFPEVMASKRFQDVVQDVIRFTGVQQIPTGERGMKAMQTVLMKAVFRILELEDGHREELEQLAIELVKKEFGIHDDDYQWDVKILDIRNPEQGQEMQDKIKDMNQEEQQEAEEEAIEVLNDIELEKYKRRFINAIIQGSAQKMNNAYFLVQEKLNAIHPDLLNLYGTMMAINDLTYWIMPEETIEKLAGAGSGAGSEEIDNRTDPPTIRARGINFATLVHEITKAVMDAIATNGLPEDEATAQAVIQSEDTLAKEAWDLRLGPVIWEKFRAAYPEKLYADDQRRIQAYLIHEFVKLPAEQFLALAKEILSGSNRGKRRLEQIVDEIIESLKAEDMADFEYNQDIENRPENNVTPEEKGEFDPTDPSTW